MKGHLSMAGVERRRRSRRSTRPPLLAVVRRAHIGLLVTVVLTVSLPISLAAGAALVTYAQHNLELIARSIAYTVEAAAVFRDSRAAAESLSEIVERESIAEARIDDADGHLIAEYRRADVAGAPKIGRRLSAALGRALWPEPTIAPIVHAGRVVGRVSLRGDPAMLVQFALVGLAGGALGLVLIVWAWRALMARLRRDIVLPLRELAAVTRTARRHGALGRRAPPAAIFELNELGEDFNALLEQVESHQASLRRENETLAHQALHDSLTGLPNRAYFNQRLQRAFDAASASGSRLAVMVLDNDHFKAINDVYGHAGGDQVLAEAARRVRAQLRESDVVARVGGDEFFVLLAPLRQVEDAARVADKIVAAMRHPVPLADGTRVEASLSVGIAVYPDHADSIDALVRAADQAMYRAKKTQRGTRQLALRRRPAPAPKEEDSR